MKTCSKCKINKSIENFHICKRTEDGIHYQCKSCIDTYHKRWRDNPKTLISAANYLTNETWDQLMEGKI